MRNQGRGLYRARDGKILGVCKGLADHFDLSLFWVRFFAVLLLLFSGIWPMLGLYFLAALIMKPAPVVPFRDDDEQEFYESYSGSRGLGLRRLKRKFENLDRRIRRMEDHVTSREYDWQRRMKRGR